MSVTPSPLQPNRSETPLVRKSRAGAHRSTRRMRIVHPLGSAVTQILKFFN